MGLLDDKTKGVFKPSVKPSKAKINAQWQGGSLLAPNGEVVMKAPSLLDAASAINQFMPVTGDIQSGLLAMNDVKKGNYSDAALNSLGLLPFIPAMGGVVKNKALESIAKSHYGVTNRASETGYILDDGTRLDLSGRHEASGYKKLGDRYIPEQGQTDYLRGERAVDHRSVNQVMDGKQYGWDALSEFIDQTGAVRYMPETGISMVHTNKPSKEQIARAVNDFRMSGNPLLIDIDHAKHGENLASGDFDNPSIDEVYKWINQQYGLLGYK
jgi:hypothetical protein